MLKIENLHFSYGAQPILENVQLELETGKIYGILGRNGAGKTTLFRNISGMLSPQSGKISFDGYRIKKNDLSFLETSNYFYSYMRAEEYLSLVVPDTNYQELADLFQLPLNELVDEYSTGMKKKLALIACILQNRTIMLLDEPYNGVDLMSNEIIYQVLERIKSKKLIILSSHILNTLTTSCDEIIVLDQSKIKQRIQRNHFDRFQLEITEEIKLKMDGIQFS